MINWVEKLAKAIEKEGISFHGMVKVGDMNVYLNEQSVDITLENKDAGLTFPLSIKESLILNKAIDACNEQTANYIVDKIMKLN